MKVTVKYDSTFNTHCSMFTIHVLGRFFALVLVGHRIKVSPQKRHTHTWRHKKGFYFEIRGSEAGWGAEALKCFSCSCEAVNRCCWVEEEEEHRVRRRLVSSLIHLVSPVSHFISPPRSFNSLCFTLYPTLNGLYCRVTSFYGSLKSHVV